jgi:hypothetical protein
VNRAIATFGAVVANRALLRVVLAYGTYTIGEWAVWIAMLVYAYERGGAAAAALVSVIQLLPSAVLTPVIAGLGDRLPRDRVLAASYAAQAATMAATAIALSVAAPIPVVYVLAILTTTAVSQTRPAHGSLLPYLARTPDELTAANVASNTVQNVGILVAPALAGLLLVAAGPGAVFAGTSAFCLLGMALVRGGRSDGVPLTVAAEATSPPGLLDGLRLLRTHGDARIVVALIACGSAIEGALDVIAVVLAIDLLAIGQGGVGALGSMIGAGGLIGAAAAAALVGRSGLAGPFAMGLVLWSLPIAVVGVVPLVVVAFSFLLMAGIGRSLMDVAGRTLLQRVAPDQTLSGVFGALEGLHSGMLAVGSLMVPVLIALAGPRLALVIAGLWLPGVTLLAQHWLRTADARAVVRVRELSILRAIPMFAPLAPPVIERLAASLTHARATPGTVLIRQGDVGDRFYIIDSGTARVDIDGRFVRNLGPGDGFGEIALLRGVPRTASVRAESAVALFALERGLFLAAITGDAVSANLAHGLVESRLDSAFDSAPEISTVESSGGA